MRFSAQFSNLDNPSGGYFHRSWQAAQGLSAAKQSQQANSWQGAARIGSCAVHLGVTAVTETALCLPRVAVGTCWTPSGCSLAVRQEVVDMLGQGAKSSFDVARPNLQLDRANRDHASSLCRSAIAFAFNANTFAPIQGPSFPYYVQEWGVATSLVMVAQSAIETITWALGAAVGCAVGIVIGTGHGLVTNPRRLDASISAWILRCGPWGGGGASMAVFCCTAPIVASLVIARALAISLLDATARTVTYPTHLLTQAWHLPISA